MSTAENLQEAFAGESQANRKYLAFAKKAEKDGYPQIARLFRAAADAETVHAHAHLRVMGGIKSTADNLQAAIDAPTVHSMHFPSSFYPRQAFLNRMAAEDRIPAEVRAELAARGHEVEVAGGWTHGRVMAARMTPSGLVEAAASPRSRMAYAAGW